MRSCVHGIAIAFISEGCLASVKKEVEVHHFIVIDRFSSDGTLEVVRSVFPDAKVFQTAANLGGARKIGIAYVDTQYFAFIDDGIELSDGWSTKLISLSACETLNAIFKETNPSMAR